MRNIVPSHRAFAANSTSSCHARILNFRFLKVANYINVKQNFSLKVTLSLANNAQVDLIAIL